MSHRYSAFKATSCLTALWSQLANIQLFALQDPVVGILVILDRHVWKLKVNMNAYAALDSSALKMVIPALVLILMLSTSERKLVKVISNLQVLVGQNRLDLCKLGNTQYNP